MPVTRHFRNLRVRALALGKPGSVFSRRACQLCPPLTRPRASVPAHRLHRHLLGGYGDSVLVFHSHFPLVLRHPHEHCAIAYSESMHSRGVLSYPFTIERRPLFGNHVIPGPKNRPKLPPGNPQGTAPQKPTNPQNDITFFL